MPINHYEGNYTCDAATLGQLEANGQIVLRYRENPNGSTASIAGVCNTAGNVVGLMPHPERAMSLLLGSDDGRPLLESFLDAASRVTSSAVTASLGRSAPVHTSTAENLRRDAGFAPRRVVDALSGAVFGSGVDEGVLERGEVFGTVVARESGFDALALLDQVQTLQGVGVAQALFDLLELLGEVVGTRTATASRSTALQRLEITADGEALSSAGRECRFMLIGHHRTLTGGVIQQ